MTIAHKSRLGGLSIDCEGGDLMAARDFWASVFGDAARQEPEGNFVRLEPRAGLSIEVQKVNHPSRVHMDIETDDVAAEVTRLEGIGARVHERIDDWVVMEAPTGHRFCVVPTDDDFFHETAKKWN